MGVAIGYLDGPRLRRSLLADEVREAIARRYHPYEILVSPVTAVLAAHAGPGAWGVFWQVEDSAPDHAGNKTAVRAL